MTQTTFQRGRAISWVAAAAGALSALTVVASGDPPPPPGLSEPPEAPTLLEHGELGEWRAGTEASELVLAWPEDRSPPRRRNVTVRARASLGHLVHHWTFEAGELPERGELVVLPHIPAEAQLDPVVADYVVDLLLTVVIDGAQVTMEPDTTDTAPSPFNQADMGDGIVDMGINPVKVTPKGRPALGAIAKGWDWLEHLIVGADAPGGNSTLGCVGDLANRGTEYDWARFFWDMTLTAGGDIDPEDLADLYVDLCPTNWQNAGDPDTSDTGAPAEPWPIYRLELSAIHQGTAVESEWSVRKVWGQDH
jgi:hypothetical protein